VLQIVTGTAIDTDSRAATAPIPATCSAFAAGFADAAEDTAAE